MVKHIVLFKLKDEASADEKLAAMNDFKKAIEALPRSSCCFAWGCVGSSAAVAASFPGAARCLRPVA
mgnify:CR=1 FL=1